MANLFLFLKTFFVSILGYLSFGATKKTLVAGVVVTTFATLVYSTLDSISDSLQDLIVSYNGVDSNLLLGMSLVNTPVVQTCFSIIFSTVLLTFSYRAYVLIIKLITGA